MEIIVSTMRWTPPLYREIARRAKEENVSINTFVRETMAKALHVEEGAKK